MVEFLAILAQCVLQFLAESVINAGRVFEPRRTGSTRPPPPSSLPWARAIAWLLLLVVGALALSQLASISRHTG